jgi:hypothetical protein
LSERSCPAASLLLFILSITLWMAALFHVALKDPGSPFHYTGLNCLLLGWIGLISNPFWVIPWLANVLYWTSLIGGVIRGSASGKVLAYSILTIPMALLTLGARKIPDSSGGFSPVVVAAGFYLWLGSLFALAGAHWIRGSLSSSS